MTLGKDLLYPKASQERRKSKLKRLVPHPNSYFMDIMCPGCRAIKTVFSHVQSVVKCDRCGMTLCSPRAGKAKLKEGCQFRRKK